jgi:hypothetical protein
VGYVSVREAGCKLTYEGLIVTGCTPSLKTDQVDMILRSTKECLASTCLSTQLDSYLTELFILRDNLTSLIGGLTTKDSQSFSAHITYVRLLAIRCAVC